MIDELNESEMASLRQSPYVEYVAPKKITYGPVFEREYHRLFQAGYSRSECFDFLGLDPEIVGTNRMRAYHNRYEKRVPALLLEQAMDGGKPLSISQELEAKDHRIKMLEQELEFLKKKMQLTHQYRPREGSKHTTSD